MSLKKAEQLGMNPSTAANRLVKDLLWNFVLNTGNNYCCRCGQEMSREDFSIEHKIPWLDSENPVEMFFDIRNIGYSHQKCNRKDARTPNKKYFTDDEKREAKNKWLKEKRIYCPLKRKAQYERTGN